MMAPLDPAAEGHDVGLHTGNSIRTGTWTRYAGVAALVLALLGAPALGPDSAQAQPGGDNIRQYIEQTGELLAWADGLVAETGSGPARRVLGQAHDLHDSSQRMLERGMMLDALSVARRARDAMWHAVRVAREAMGLEERIRIRDERYQDEFASLMERAREADNQQAIDFLMRARREADRARDIYRQGDFQMAWRLFEQAGDLMNRAGRLLAGGVSPERLELELTRAREAIDRAREQMGPGVPPHRQELLVEAEDAVQRALSARDRGEPGRALHLCDMARTLAQRAGRPGEDGGPGPDAFRRQLDRFADRAARLGDAVAEAGSEPARDLVQRALRQRDRAVEADRAGDAELALRQIRAAHDLLSQAEELIR